MRFWRRTRESESDLPLEGGSAEEPEAAPEPEAEAPDEAALDERVEATAAPAIPAPAADVPAVEPEPQPIGGFGGPSAAQIAGDIARWPDAPPAIEVAPIGAGLGRTRGTFVSRLRGILASDGDAASWDDVEETLIAADVGASLAMDVVERARARRDPAGPESAVRAELAALLAPRQGTWEPVATDEAPAVILVVGVNGTGKTTTIGKLAARYRSEGRRVILAAADTFRAAAIDQLRIWAERAAAPMVAHAPGADPGAVVYDALDAAVAREADLVIADTAGRLHTKSNLMEELAKIRRIVDKRLPGTEPEMLFVLDATTGQNGLAQATAFHDAVGLTGIVLTKLDSTAKGGIVFAIEGSLGVPVRFVGVGEQVGDLVPFDPDAFVAALFE